MPQATANSPLDPDTSNTPSVSAVPPLTTEAPVDSPVATKAGSSIEDDPSNRRGILAIARWFDTYAQARAMGDSPEQKVDWLRCVPFALLHMSPLAVIWVGWSPAAFAVCAGMYVLRMFAITGFYHRYFSHRSFKTSRAGQFIFAVLGASATQRGPLWWASHHRMHHKHSDGEEDVHSPKQHGLSLIHI